MELPDNQALPAKRGPEGVPAFLRWLASLKLAVVLLVLLIAVLIPATLLDPAYGAWYVYNTGWFVALMALLAVNILAATLIRYPWNKRLGFLITHCGLLLLLAGAVVTYFYKVEGHVRFAEGETVEEMRLYDVCQFTVRWDKKAGGETPPNESFTFAPGPVDWPAGKTLDFGGGDLQFRVLKYYAHAATKEQWLADESRQGIAALRVALLRPTARR